MKTRPAFLDGDRVLVNGELATVRGDSGPSAVWVRTDKEPSCLSSHGHDEVELIPRVPVVTWLGDSVGGVRAGHYGASHGAYEVPTQAPSLPFGGLLIRRGVPRGPGWPPIEDGNAGMLGFLHETKFCHEYQDQKLIRVWSQVADGDWKSQRVMQCE